MMPEKQLQIILTLDFWAFVLFIHYNNTLRCFTIMMKNYKLNRNVFTVFLNLTSKSVSLMPFACTVYASSSASFLYKLK